MLVSAAIKYCRTHAPAVVEMLTFGRMILEDEARSRQPQPCCREKFQVTVGKLDRAQSIRKRFL
jgi:hypothetical protein